MIRIELLAGPRAGLQTTHDEQVISFGRAANNTLRIDSPHMSREHGELHHEQGRWWLLNFSPNGVTVNRRRAAEREPHPLKPGDVIGVGRHKLFAVDFTPEERAAGSAPAADADEAEAAAARSGPALPRLSQRAKLWVGIGALNLAVLIVVLIALATGGAGMNRAPTARQLTKKQIAEEIRRPVQRRPDERKAAHHLQQARERYSRLGAAPDTLYRAHRHYKLARAYSASGKLEGIDQLQYQKAQKMLIDRVAEAYQRAYTEVASRRWAQAVDTLRRVEDIYPDTDSKLFRNVQQLLSVARRRKAESEPGFG